MRRKPLAAMFVLLSAALVLGGNALLDAGWGSALRSIADRVLPNPEIAMWAPAPEPGCVPSSKNRQIRLSNFDTLMLTASGRAGAVAAGPPAA